MIEVDIGGIWGEVSLPDLLKMEYDIFQAHLGLEEQTPVAEFDVRSYNNPVWLYAACRRMMANCGRSRETLAVSEASLERGARLWRELFGAGDWILLPGKVPDGGFVTVLHRGEAAAEALLAELADRSIPAVSITAAGPEAELEAFFRLARALEPEK